MSLRIYWDPNPIRELKYIHSNTFMEQKNGWKKGKNKFIIPDDILYSVLLSCLSDDMHYLTLLHYYDVKRRKALHESFPLYQPNVFVHPRSLLLFHKHIDWDRYFYFGTVIHDIEIVKKKFIKFIPNESTLIIILNTYRKYFFDGGNKGGLLMKDLLTWILKDTRYINIIGQHKLIIGVPLNNPLMNDYIEILKGFIKETKINQYIKKETKRQSPKQSHGTNNLIKLINKMF